MKAAARSKNAREPRPLSSQAGPSTFLAFRLQSSVIEFFLPEGGRSCVCFRIIRARREIHRRRESYLVSSETVNLAEFRFAASLPEAIKRLSANGS